MSCTCYLSQRHELGDMSRIIEIRGEWDEEKFGLYVSVLSSDSVVIKEVHNEEASDEMSKQSYGK